MSNLKAESYTAEAYEAKCAELEKLWCEHEALVAERKRMYDEIEKAKCETQVLREQLMSIKSAEIAFKATISVLNLIFAGREFCDYERIKTVSVLRW